MDDPPGVGRLQGDGHLARGLERLPHGRPSAPDPLGQRLSGDVLEDEEARRTVLVELVERCDVRVVQLCEEMRLASETGDRLQVGRDSRREDLESDFPPDPRVACEVHLAHSPRAQRDDDLERTQAGP